ncbi:MAG: hypothetical protein D6735_04215 [Acidobacteria bacterium]|jgi:hypothetical protein|nr:MAG: hypothetical protein D6735_04215 [Acidobacteriota bacterium]
MSPIALRMASLFSDSPLAISAIENSINKAQQTEFNLNENSSLSKIELMQNQIDCTQISPIMDKMLQNGFKHLINNGE